MAMGTDVNMCYVRHLTIEDVWWMLAFRYGVARLWSTVLSAGEIEATGVVLASGYRSWCDLQSGTRGRSPIVTSLSRYDALIRHFSATRLSVILHLDWNSNQKGILSSKKGSKHRGLSYADLWWDATQPSSSPEAAMFEAVIQLWTALERTSTRSYCHTDLDGSKSGHDTRSSAMEQSRRGVTQVVLLLQAVGLSRTRTSIPVTLRLLGNSSLSVRLGPFTFLRIVMASCLSIPRRRVRKG